jgi:predicted NUDIX family phosphoesterase
VDRVHLGLIWVHELDGTGIEAVEDQLHEIGFVPPLELLNGKYNLETWAKIICHMILPAQ